MSNKITEIINSVCVLLKLEGREELLDVAEEKVR